MPLALITGANRGLGLEFTRQYMRDGWQVIGCCRNPDAAHELADAGAEVMKLDVTQAADVTAASKRLAATSIDLVVCNAGVAGARAPVLSPVTQADFDQVMRTNVLGPMWVSAALADHILPGGKIAYLSSRMGSIGLMTNAGSALYRASKAALNAVVKAVALELASRGVTAIALHPGWVKTDMGGAGADIDAETSVAGMRAVIERARSDVSGHFFDYTGKELPW
ncbi:MAG TPA: SDR family oxidoreductase [Casimicrobiaceae bacterium]|jgi:NAD(P)-dependent dehydrogenase (short-subunit alcohol dehydrogenase family)|nr:SDR family oxidoreductase [Casimicrobiaceae bacterium]